MAQRHFPPPKADPAYRDNLPLQLTSFFGRETELSQLREMVLAEKTRLVTLTGPGGTGKTRLALEVAEQTGHAAEVWFVPLEDVPDPQHMVDALFDTLRVRCSRHASAPGTDLLGEIVDMFSQLNGDRPVLLLLDNFEHLVPGGTALVHALLERVPRLTCLVTSRQRLGLKGEREFMVKALPLPHLTGTPEQLMQCSSV